MKRLLPMLLLLAVCLTGCSNGVDPTKDVTIKWENGVTSYNGTTFTVDSYNGYSASVTNGSGGLDYTLSIDSAKDVTNLTVNYSAVEEENMNKYKEGFYFSEYLGSRLTYAREIADDTWSVCQVVTRGTDLALAANYAELYVSSVPLTNGQVYVDFGDFIFGNQYDVVEVRPDCALITGIAKVSVDTHDCSTPITVVQDKKEYQLMKGSSAKYDYYQYGDYLIQLSGGLDISQYIKFK